MFSGFNILDNLKPHDILNDIQKNKFSSFSQIKNPSFYSSHNKEDKKSSSALPESIPAVSKGKLL